MKSLLELDEGLVADIRKASIVEANLEDFLSKGTLLLQEHFQSKCITIYLSVKEPFLQLFYMLDRDGNYIKTKDKRIKYEAGQGLVGKLFNDQLQCCKPYIYLESISEIALSDIQPNYNGDTPEKNILVIPLTGENRILGAIEFVDSIKDFSEPCDYIMSAYIVSQVFSRAVGSLLRGEMTKVIEGSSVLGIEVLNRKLSEDAYLKEVTDLIVDNSLINYHVSIIRIFSKVKEEVKVESFSSNSNIDWSFYKKNNYPRTISHSSECFLSGKVKIVPDINDTNIDGFYNKKWVRDNKLKAYICIPIKFSNECIGTLSLFLKYPYHFYSADFNFLRLLSHAVGKTIGLEERMGLVRKEVAENTRATVRELSDLLSIKEFSHAYKNDIRIIKDTLDKVIPTLAKGKINELKVLSSHLDEKKIELDSLIKSYRGDYGIKTTFSINDLLNEITSHYRTEIELEGISIEKNYGNIPYVVMDKNRLLEAISNIFLNAIKSFKEISPRSDKVISLSHR